MDILESIRILVAFACHINFTPFQMDVKSTFLNGFIMKDILIVQIYVDDIIFGASNTSFCKEFAKCMQDEFKMSMMEELNFFLRLQIKQTKDNIFINQGKYIKDLLKDLGWNMSRKLTHKCEHQQSLIWMKTIRM
jgi:hypothetical protein